MTQIDRVTTANALYRANEYAKALKLYESIALQEGWNNLLYANIKLCYKKLGINNDLYRQTKLDEYKFSSSSPQIVVAMTTIRSRLAYIPKVIKSILEQTLKPVRIDINVSKQPYLIDEGIDLNDPVLVELMKNTLININWTENIGPYRKIWPFLENHFLKPKAEDSIFVTIDDDTIYPDYFLENLYKNYLLYDCVVAFRGRYIEIDTNGLMTYEKWTLGKNKPSLNNLPTGKDGILYSTKFFTKEFLDLKNALQLAPTADDLWIKWHHALNGVPSVILNPEACTSDYKSFPVVNYNKSYRGNSLYAIHNSSKSENKNDKSIQQLEDFYKLLYGYNLAWLIQVGA